MSVLGVGSISGFFRLDLLHIVEIPPIIPQTIQSATIAKNITRKGCIVNLDGLDSVIVIEAESINLRGVKTKETYSKEELVRVYNDS